MNTADAINSLADGVHEANRKWWINIHTGEPLDRNFGEIIALIHSELSEALEGHRKSLPDAHLPHRSSAEVEFADVLIRLLDAAAGFGYDLGGAFVEKMVYNAERVDHTHEHRLSPEGKKY